MNHQHARVRHVQSAGGKGLRQHQRAFQASRRAGASSSRARGEAYQAAVGRLVSEVSVMHGTHDFGLTILEFFGLLWIDSARQNAEMIGSQQDLKAGLPSVDYGARKVEMRQEEKNM